MILKLAIIEWCVIVVGATFLGAPVISTVLIATGAVLIACAVSQLP